MADIFISYTHNDRESVAPLAKTLEELGWAVWWDPIIPAGKDFDEVIEEELSKAGCVIVIWTKKSVKSKYVKGEAREALSRDILVPIELEPGAKPPFDFRSVKAISLIDWDYSDSFPGFQKLIDSIVRVLGGSPAREQKRKREEAEQGAIKEHRRKQEEERRPLKDKKRKAGEDRCRPEEESQRLAVQKRKLEKKSISTFGTLGLFITFLMPILTVILFYKDAIEDLGVIIIYSFLAVPGGFRLSSRTNRSIFLMLFCGLSFGLWGGRELAGDNSLFEFKNGGGVAVFEALGIVFGGLIDRIIHEITTADWSKKRDF
jgi:hypothetical protein